MNTFTIQIKSEHSLVSSLFANLARHAELGADDIAGTASKMYPVNESGEAITEILVRYVTEDDNLFDTIRKYVMEVYPSIYDSLVLGSSPEAFEQVAESKDKDK